MSQYTQEHRPLAIETPLGKDALLLTAFSGTEEFSRLFAYELEFLSEKKSIPDKDIIGKNVTFWVEFPDGKPRHFNGIVNRFAYCGTGDRLSLYRATVVPFFWLLTRTSDCRIFQDKSVPDIIQAVISEAGLASNLKLDLKGNHEKWDYCVQYRETDFHFLSRLMEEEGIFYYFTHEQGKHTLVVGDKRDAYATSADKSVQFLSNLSQPESTDQITAWEHQYEFKSGKWAHTDYNFETSATSLLSPTNSVLGLPGADKFELFDFPGGYEKKAQGDNDVKLRMEEEEAGYNVVHGESVCRGFNPGHKFQLAKHHNAAEAGKGYVVTAVRHQARCDTTYVGGSSASGEIYRNSFTCIPDSVTYRPPRVTAKSRIHGVQTAVVTGPAGEEIYTDKYGRIKVQFHWDREGKKDDKTSCWVRCSQSIAGKNWGAMTIPRIGQEVVVAYLDGDPDRPLVTGVVYNDAQMPAYPLPDEKTKSSLKTNSSPGGAGFNEIRFEDKKGKEQLFAHAQKDMDVRVLNDQRTSIGHDRHLTVHNDVREKIVGRKEIKIGGDVLETIEGQVTQRIEGDEHQKVGGGRFEFVSGDEHSEIGGNRNEKIGMSGSQEFTMNLDQKIGQNLAIDAGMSVHIKAGMTMVLEAGMQLSLKVGGNFVDLSPAGVAINGILVMINSGGAAGSGAGCNPTAPELPAEPVPADPDEADATAKSGQKSCP
jgi:type VI secretion system secreted protein VgrG